MTKNVSTHCPMFLEKSHPKLRVDFKLWTPGLLMGVYLESAMVFNVLSVYFVPNIRRTTMSKTALSLK